MIGKSPESMNQASGHARGFTVVEGFLCGSPQIVEGWRLRGVRDGRRGGLLVIDR